MWVTPMGRPGKLTPPEARSLSSSCVRLAAGARVGEHVTAGREELLFVLEGEAVVHAGGVASPVPQGHAAYVPPETRHDVENRGTGPLTYVYVTAPLPG